jgi:hypothetical protein
MYTDSMQHEPRMRMDMKDGKSALGSFQAVNAVRK